MDRNGGESAGDRIERWKGALAPAAEAVTRHRRLVESGGDARLPAFAVALDTLAGILLRVDRPEEALASAEEAVGIYRRLADAEPETYLPHLARSLYGFEYQLVRGYERRPSHQAPPHLGGMATIVPRCRGQVRQSR